MAVCELSSLEIVRHIANVTAEIDSGMLILEQNKRLLSVLQEEAELRRALRKEGSEGAT